MIDRLSIRGERDGHVLRLPHPFKHTHYTFIRALNTSHGIEWCCTTYIYIRILYTHIHIYIFVFPLPPRVVL